MSLGVFICGSSGRMGQEILKLINQRDDLRFCGGLDKNGPQVQDENIDVVIDFSLPEAMDQVADFCEQRKVPLVSGTTGLKPTDNSKLISLSRFVPVFWSANMSLGVYALNRLIESLAGLKLNFDFQITETHHTNKLDAPSGTALKMEKTAKSSGLSLEPTVSIREGLAFGKHEFKASSPMETITLTHEATSRELFADGALQIAHWLVNEKPGFFAMQDFFEN